MSNSFVHCGVVLCLLVLTGFAPRVPAVDQVRVRTGLLEGTTGTMPGIRAFLGIPYAAPPVGALRWKAPQPALPWTGVRKADHFANRCVQTTPFADMIFRSAAESEDCLSLSIWTPAKSTTERLPVMVWIHGGGFFSGASDEGRHEGSVLASKGVVLVAINYRLGVLGFLAHPELTAESGVKASGNYGLLDQIAALQWVHDNIATFGGDASRVTIFGESAGSFSVSALMASPRARGLFHSAIGESGAYFAGDGGTLPLLSLAAAEKKGKDLATAVGASSLADLRARPAAALIKAVGQDSTRFIPILDGQVLTADPWDAFAAGRQSHVPLLAGWNSAEVKAKPTTTAAFATLLTRQFPDDITAARRAYPASTDREATMSAVALASDNFIAYGTWKWIETHTATGGSPVYRYLFDQIVPTTTGNPPPDDPGAEHASDIEYVFHALESKKLAWRPADQHVADLMTSYWTNFAKTDNPNGAGLPLWPAWTGAATGRQVMRINAQAHAEPESHRDRYELQDTVAKRQRAKAAAR